MRNVLFGSFLLGILPFMACKNGHEKIGSQRGFYYWKSNFRLTPGIKQPLQQLKVGHLYVKLFDVAWDASKKQAIPVAPLSMKESFPASIKVTPVVFITLEAIRNSNELASPVLASHIANLIQKLTKSFENQLSGEIQIDCDWTGQTREVYFKLLQNLKEQPFFQGRQLSVTIRLHQVKYINENGIPPADRGLLMCYNMGNLRDPSAKNSIIDPATFKSYTNRLKDYPLPLDIALPLFEWWVWFRNNQYYGLVHAGHLPETFGSGLKTKFAGDTMVNGYHFLPGDWLRHEISPVGSIEKVIGILPPNLRTGKNKLILFHLDSATISKYSIHELQSFYHHFD